MTDVNLLGNFTSIAEVWGRYPQGGVEGDYLYVGDVKYRWDKYELNWRNANAVINSDLKELAVFDGEVDINNDLHVAGNVDIKESVDVEGNLTVRGVLYAGEVQQPNLGLFPSVEVLRRLYPKPTVGMWALVGTTIPAQVYSCKVVGVWEATGEWGGAVDLSGLAIRMEIDTQGEQVLAFGESTHVVCRVFRWWDDITAFVTRWSVVRDSGDAADDAVWSLKEKVKNFSGEIDISFTSSDNDLGSNYNTISTVFTFTAELSDGETATYQLEI